MNTLRSCKLRRTLCAFTAATLPAALTLAAPPTIYYTRALQAKTVFAGTTNTFRVTATSDLPSTYEWRLDGVALPGQTTNTLTLENIQASQEGDYTVVVSNADGAATSRPVRLWVIPADTQWTQGNYTNAAGVRLPYFYSLPHTLVPDHKYPLVFFFPGEPVDESSFLTWFGPEGTFPTSLHHLSASYRQQEVDPAVVVVPTRRAGTDWSAAYATLTSEFLDQIPMLFSTDTDRIYAGGNSGGLHKAWDLIASRPGDIAAAQLGAGALAGSWVTVPPAPVQQIPDLPLWMVSNGGDWLLGETRAIVQQLRRVGRNPIYTEYQQGGHGDGIILLHNTPTFVNWLLSQRRGVPSKSEPLLTITNLPSAGLFTNSAPTVSLAGWAEALGETITLVTWTNRTSRLGARVEGTNLWSAANIPLVPDKTNIISVVATTTSWDLADGGTTTFSDTVSVYCAPIRVTLAWDGVSLNLSWTGGVPPYEVQRATNLALGDWVTIQTDATPPLALSADGATGFYRILGQ